MGYRVSPNACSYVFPNLPKKRNLTAMLLILIPEYGQSNATRDKYILTLCASKYHRMARLNRLLYFYIGHDLC